MNGHTALLRGCHLSVGGLFKVSIHTALFDSVEDTCWVQMAEFDRELQKFFGLSQIKPCLFRLFSLCEITEKDVF